MAVAGDLASAAQQLPHGGYPTQGLATAGQLREAQLPSLAEAGYRVILDLRTAGESRGYEEAAAVARAGMRYVHFPVFGPSVTTETFDRFRAIVRDASLRPIVVHCATANRVGAMLLPYFVLDEGRTLDDAWATAAHVGMRRSELAVRALDYLRGHGVDVPAR